MNLRLLIERVIYRYFFRLRKPRMFAEYVDAFCSVYPDICSDLSAGVCPFCGYDSRGRLAVLANHFRFSAECSKSLSAAVSEFVDLYSLALTHITAKKYYGKYSKHRELKCTVCGYTSKKKTDIVRHIIEEHLPILTRT